MKTIILSLLTSILLFNIVFGQDRINRPKLEFSNKSDILTKATGWKYNTTKGEWIDNENVIFGDKIEKDSKYSSIEYILSRQRNFISMQIKSLLYNGDNYYVLMIEKWNGYYKYPSISEDWQYHKELMGYIFTENEYKKILSSDMEINLESHYLTEYGWYHDKYDEILFLDKIQNTLNNIKPTQTEGKSKKSKSKQILRYSYTYTFPIRKTDKNLIRFLIPDDYSGVYPKIDFEKQYFETTAENFDKIIIK